MVEQGLLGLLLFGIIVFIVSHKLKQYKEHPYTKVLTIILVAYFVDFITEMYQMPHLLFCVIFYCAFFIIGNSIRSSFT